MYDAVWKIASGRGTDAEGQTWTLEFRERRADDSMAVVLRDPAGGVEALTLTEDDFAFTEETVTLRPRPAVTLRMPPVYLKKLRGFTRGNTPTPNIPGPFLP